MSPTRNLRLPNNRGIEVGKRQVDELGKSKRKTLGRILLLDLARDGKRGGREREPRRFEEGKKKGGREKGEKKREKGRNK